ncbi:hypothetical protein, partial [Campylobacter canadensis]|uniref:hypothetical protein n=1 Tax=Campylobacter canadensis TaxID=449520 RepID=UPI001CC9D975
MYSSRKIKKLMREPKLFFKDAFLNNYRIANKLINNFKAKKYKAYSKYAIISAVYNVEKYLDDFFKS